MSLSCKILVPQQQQYHKRFKILHNPCFQQHPFVSFPKKCFHSSGVQLMGFSSTMQSILSSGNSGLLINRCISEKFSNSLGPNDSESLEQHQRFKILHNPCFQQHPFVSFPKKCFHSSGVQLMGFPSTMQSILPSGNSGLLINRCISEKFSDSLGPNDSESLENLKQKENALLTILKGANSYLPHVVLASTILALIYPPSFTWFTNRYYAPALGFLMFAVGVNSSEKDFLEAFKKPGAIFAGYIGQFAVKPLLGYLFGTAAMTVFGLPTSLAAGIMLTSCVSGAQLSNYATFLTDPQMAPLSIVMTSFSTATAAFVTPILSLLLIGKKLPVDVKGMIANILQIVVTPIAAGLLLNRFFPQISNAIRPLLPPLSVLVTALCVGAPLAINIESVVSPSGMSVLFLVIAFHLSAFILGYLLSGLAFHNAPDVKPLQRTLSYETGMQSSLLALALANKFFQDPLIGVPPAISVVIMSLMGFSLVMLWAKKKETVMG